jgi:hypothetical protein
MSYTALEFKLYWLDVPKFQGLPDSTVDRAIQFISAAWHDFRCYDPTLYVLLYHLGVAHQIESTCTDPSTPWFSPNVTEVKSYNDTVKFASDDDDLSTTVYGRQFRQLLDQRQPVLYFGANSCW